MTIGPYAQDILTRIINVQWGTAQQWLLGIANQPDANIRLDQMDTLDVKAKDGSAWANAAGGASGLGLTVIANGGIAFGSIELPDDVSTDNPDGKKRRDCFMRSNPGDVVYLGLVDEGEITWSQIWKAGEDNIVISVSFANELFFITWVNTAGDGETRLTVTRNGTDFTEGVNPFPGIAPDQLFGGNVVYSKDLKRFVTAGSWQSEDTETEFNTAFSTAFTWSTSIDGYTWTAGKPPGLFGQPGGMGKPNYSTIAFGNDIFVAAATQKHTFTELVAGTTAPYILTSCAVATSTNGTTWNLVPLPGAVVRSDPELGDRAGMTTAVVFIKKGSDDGYFIAVGNETGGTTESGNFEPVVLKMWQSEDGASWRLVQQGQHDMFDPKGGDYSTLSAIDEDKNKIVVVS